MATVTAAPAPRMAGLPEAKPGSGGGGPPGSLAICQLASADVGAPGALLDYQVGHLDVGDQGGAGAAHLEGEPEAHGPGVALVRPLP